MLGLDFSRFALDRRPLGRRFLGGSASMAAYGRTLGAPCEGLGGVDAGVLALDGRT